MSYRIEYGSAVPVRFQEKKRKSHLRVLTALFMLLFALGVGQFWPEGQRMLRDFLLPGEPTVTEQAFSGMIEHLTGGVPLEEAMAAFCQQIIDHGTGEGA